MYLLNNNISKFKLLDNIPGRSDKGKKRKGIKGLIQTAKENPVETAALVTGGILAARYGSAGIKTALRARGRMKDKYRILDSHKTLGMRIKISNVPKSKIRQKQAIALGSAFLKGSGNKARKDIKNVKKTINYIKIGKK